MVKLLKQLLYFLLKTLFYHLIKSLPHPYHLKDKIKEIDDKAFIIVSHVEEVSGNGFTYTKEMREA